MILYSQNPNLDLPVKTTAGGDKEYRNNCKFIKGKYYRIGDEVFEIDGTWYRKESGKIEYDSEIKRWVLKMSTQQLVSGIVGFDIENNHILGKFTKNPLNNVLARTDYDKYYVKHVELVQKAGYIENVATGEFHAPKNLGATGIAKIQKIRNELDHTRKGYNIEDNADEFANKKEIYSIYCPPISKDAKLFGKLLSDVSWGIEWEASEGYLSDYLQYRNGIIVCRDGSIQGGPEFVSIPLQGPKGLQTTYNACQELSKRCNIDIHCSLHIHLGNLPQDRSYLVALYILFYKIQDELFKMLPYYKTDPRGIKKKNYCQKLKNMAVCTLKDTSKAGFKEYVDDVYYKIFMFLSDGIPPDEHNNRNMNQHPVRHKWDRTNRLAKSMPI